MKVATLHDEPDIYKQDLLSIIHQQNSILLPHLSLEELEWGKYKNKLWFQLPIILDCELPFQHDKENDSTRITLLAQAYNQNDCLSPSWTNMTLLNRKWTWRDQRSSQAVAIVQVALPFFGRLCRHANSTTQLLRMGGRHSRNRPMNQAEMFATYSAIMHKWTTLWGSYFDCSSNFSLCFAAVGHSYLRPNKDLAKGINDGNCT